MLNKEVNVPRLKRQNYTILSSTLGGVRSVGSCSIHADVPARCRETARNVQIEESDFAHHTEIFHRGFS